MKTLALVLVSCLALAGLSRAGEGSAAKGAAKPAAAASWEDRVEQALDAKSAFEGWNAAPLPDVLKAVGQAAGVAVVLDPKAAADPEKIKITLSIPKDSPMTLRAVLGNVLKLAGLRYMLKDQAILVSTRERLVSELLATDSAPAPWVPGVSGPMTTGDALAATVDFYDGSEEYLPQSILDFVRAPVDARFERAPYRDAQGRLNFPGPPMIIQDADILDPNRRFDTKPYFLKPAYLAPFYWGPPSQPVVADQAKVRDTEALKALLDYMQKHPEITVGQLIQQLEALSVKGAAPRQ